MNIEDTKLNFEFAVAGARLPDDCCSVLNQNDWSTIAATRISDGLQIAVMAINAALLKVKPTPRALSVDGDITRIDVIHAYENALRQGLGTRAERGTLLCDDLGM